MRKTKVTYLHSKMHQVILLFLSSVVFLVEGAGLRHVIVVAYLLEIYSNINMIHLIRLLLFWESDSDFNS